MKELAMMNDKDSIYRVPYEKYEMFLDKELTEEDIAYLRQCIEECRREGGRAAGACCFGIAGRFRKEIFYIESILNQ